MRQGKRASKDADYLPGHIWPGLRSDLEKLLARAADDGPKGAYLAKECFSKYCDASTVSPEMRRQAAINKWRATERRNLATNSRLMLAEEELDFGWITWGKLRSEIRALIARILGPVRYPLVLFEGNHTNGASTRVKRSTTSALDKLTGIAHATSSALPHWELATVQTVLEDQKTVVRESSGLFTVPKSTDIDRVACKEPEVNTFLQRSVGLYIRRRLRRTGINLTDQSINRELARHAVKRQQATIDLSSASDSISRQLVIELLPFEWWSLMDDLRSKSTIVDGISHEFEMFSSMGNGFTFELESLLFYAITRVVCERSKIPARGLISVFGDDIIAPSKCVPRLKRVFDFLGFKLNPKKTNYRGPFRESCGGHFYKGVDITPFYVRGPIVRKSALIRLLNQLLEWDGRGWGFFTSDYAAEFHRKWAYTVPRNLWGGQDIESSDSLVTGTPPRKRLYTEMEEVEYCDYAGYLYWHAQRRLSGNEPIVCDPRRPLRTIIVSQPAWLERTSWTPYLIFEDTMAGGDLVL